MSPKTIDEPIDIHRHETHLRRELESLQRDERLLPENRATLERFIRDARIGRTVRRGSVRRLSHARCRKLLTILRRFAMELRVPFEQTRVQDMERFIIGVEDGEIRKLSRIRGSDRYSPETVLDFKKIIRKFYTWLLPDDPGRIADLTAWFDTRRVLTEPKAFDPASVPKLAEAMFDPQGQALVWLLFDGGMRIGELLNVRLNDVWFKKDQDNQWLCFIRIRVSKTFARTIALPMATESVLTWLRFHPDGGSICENGCIETRDSSATLICWGYKNCCKRLKKVGEYVLGVSLHPHQFRHTSATFWCSRLTPYPFCARFGWTMGSAQAERYINRSGVLAEQAALALRGDAARQHPSPLPPVHPLPSGFPHASSTAFDLPGTQKTPQPTALNLREEPAPPPAIEAFGASPS
ncbi:MAG: hypothetical protein H6814_09040 [Phycisphaeraceae bacterium]|nr:hypothetical protein [Phycisphaeraceae bacterium]